MQGHSLQYFHRLKYCGASLGGEARFFLLVDGNCIVACCHFGSPNQCQLMNMHFDPPLMMVGDIPVAVTFLKCYHSKGNEDYCARHF